MNIELLFKVYSADNKVLGTGYTLPSLIASFSRDEIVTTKVCLWCGLRDWRGHNIYAGDILSYWWQKDDKKFIGQVMYEPQLGCWIVFHENKKRGSYIDITKSGMSGGADGMNLTDAELVGNIYQYPNLLNSVMNVQESDTTESDAQPKAG